MAFRMRKVIVTLFLYINSFSESFITPVVSKKRQFASTLKLFSSPHENRTESTVIDEDTLAWVGGLKRWSTQKNDTDMFPSFFNIASLLSAVQEQTLKGSPPSGSRETQIDQVPEFIQQDFLEEAAEALVDDTKSNVTFLQDLGDWYSWVGKWRPDASRDIIKQATERIEGLVAGASAVISPKAVEDLVQTTLNPQNVTERLSNLEFVSVAEGLLRKGYVDGTSVSGNEVLSGIPSKPGSRALFADFPSCVEVSKFSPRLALDAQMGALAGAIYIETEARTKALGHSIVAQGVTDNVRWMVTDSVVNDTSFLKGGSSDPYLLRTITIRGFDASDEEVDREELLSRVCEATPEEINLGDKTILIHASLRRVARSIYNDVRQYIDWTGPEHKIVLNGHSIGGALSLLMLIEMTLEDGAEDTVDKVRKVLTFGSPPVTAMRESFSQTPGDCPVLQSLGIPSSLVHAYVQPWDPIVRLFSSIDPLYPLVGDMSIDGVTPYISGPPRTLRPVVKAIVEAWDGWPEFRDILQASMSQNYTSAGTPHLLLPDSTRYLADRFFAVNIPVPAVETIVRLSTEELQPALEKIFLLDTFEISYVPQAIRSFVHHFFPAYDDPLVDYARRLQETNPMLEEEEVWNEVDEMIKADESDSAWKVATKWFQD